MEYNVIQCTSKTWKIPKDLDRDFNTKNIKKDLNLFDRICQNNLRPCYASFFVVDFYKRKITTGALDTPLFTGCHASLLESYGLDFYKLILSKDEVKWWEQFSTAMQDVFHSFPKSERQNLTFSYELVATDVGKRNVILQHTLIPYKLDKNGNMWLGLCRVKTAKRLSVLGKAFVVNSETGEQLDYDEGHFLPSAITLLTKLEIEILSHMASGLQRKEVADAMKISENTVKKKLQSILKKLNVGTSVAAVYKATQMKII